MIRAVLLLLVLAGSAAAQEHRGGTLRLLSHSAAGTLDPQVNYTAQYWQIFCITHDGLVAFRKVAGAAGLEIVPDLAESVAQSGDGLLYTFRLRRGIRFSDGAPLRAADVLASFRRIFKVRSPTADTFYGAIQGADACLKSPDDCTLPGVAADGDVVTIRLTRPDPEFLTKLALPHASIVEATAPASDAGTAPLAGTGPYRIESYDPNDRLVLARNPYFRLWSAAAQPEGYPDTDRIRVRPRGRGGGDRGRERPSGLDVRHAAAGPAGRTRARAMPGRCTSNPSFAMWFVPLNMHLPPFDDLRVRQAFNLAVDRAAALKLFGGDRTGGGRPAKCCRRVCWAMSGTARTRTTWRGRGRSSQASGTAGQSVTLVTDDSPVSRDIGTYLRDVLAELGFVARLRSLSANIQFTYIQNTANRVQASLTNWYADYPSPGNFLLGVFGCAAFQPNSELLAEHLRLLRPGAGRGGAARRGGAGCRGDCRGGPGGHRPGAGGRPVQPELHRRAVRPGWTDTSTTRRSAG